MKKLLLGLLLYITIIGVSIAQKKISQQWTAIAQTIDISQHASKNIRLSIKSKVIVNSANSAGSPWMRVTKKNGETGTFINLTKEPIVSLDWSDYSITGIIDDDASTLTFGALAGGDGKFYFDDFKLEIEENKDNWTIIPIDNGDFNRPIAKGKIPSWEQGIGRGEVIVREFKITSSDDTQDNKGYSILITGSGISKSPKEQEYAIIYSDALNNNGEVIAINNVNYVDVLTGKPKKGSILIADGIIKEINRKLKIPTNTITIDGKDKWLIPGLIDSHIHLFQSGGLYTRPDAFDLSEIRSYQTERDWLKFNAPDLLKRYLKAGITSVIDVGGPMYNYKIRDQFNKPNEYPNVYLTGPLISTYQPKAFDIVDAPILKANNAEEAVKMVKDQLSSKPDLIKIWYIASNEEEAKTNYPIIEATIKESHLNGLPVAVHATQLYTAKLALKAGADFLVHSVDDPIDDEFIKMLKTNDAVYIPTLMVSKKYMETFSGQRKLTKEDLSLSNPIPLGSLQDIDHLQKNPLVKRVKPFAEKRLTTAIKENEKINFENLKKLIQNGINIATGTDAGNIGTLHASSYYEEIDLMKKAGLSNAEILKASTINAARTVFVEKKLGSIEKGKMADLVLLNSNPLEDINAIKDIKYVIKGGSAYETNNIITNTPEQLVQQQVNGYNEGDIDAFLEPYSDDIKIFTFPNTLTNEGKAKIKPGYESFFKENPNLHCEIVNRIVDGNTVIDQERITGLGGDRVLNAVAIYKIKDGKITEVYFVRN